MRSSSLRNFNRTRATSVRVAAFTLVELMIVIIILGVVASLAIPQFSGASREARENTLRDDLRFLRSQVQMFRAQHRDVAPGYPHGNMGSSPTENDFCDQMLLFTSERCETSTTGSDVYKFGPYLSRVPANPINNQSTIFMVGNGEPLPTDFPVMNGSDEYGWIYKAETQEWKANCAGTDANGTLYSSY
jgi:general secretion pathway protein G